MSERDGFQPGVPSWVDVMGPDPRLLTGFYGSVFGWDFSDPGQTPGDPPGEYFIALLRGRAVAGVASLPADANEPGWNTYIEVEDVDDTARRIEEAGGTVLVEPFDAPPAGRIAVVADPDGASFAIWKPGERRGAQLVNEPGAWSMSALNPGDRERAESFYGTVFGWTVDKFELGEIEVGLFRLPGFVGGEPEQPVPRDLVATMLPQPGRAPGWGVAFWVDDVDRAAAAAGESGGSVVSPPADDVPGFRQAVLADPNGVAFSVSQLMLGE
jgi:predicted enzyme related to lactoylglutathione lyase